MNIEKAVKACKETKYSGWQMVTFVQKYVNRQMKYSLENTTDHPRQAFERGKGYCWQQAWCVQYILKQLNIRSKLVYTRNAVFYEDRTKKKVTHENAHVWCQVRLNDTIKDVCSCNKENLPGDVNFVPKEPVKTYNILALAGGYIGTAFLNNTSLK